MRFLNQLKDDILAERVAEGVKLLVVKQDVEVETTDGRKVTIESGVTIRQKKKLRGGAIKCRAPYVGVFDLPKGAKFIEKPRDKWTIEDVCEYVVLEETRDEKLFYLDLLEKGDVGKRFQGAFISQARKSDFVDLVESLLNHYENDDLATKFVWIDLFSANQPLLTTRDQDLPEKVQKNREELLKVGLHDAIRKFDDRLIFFNSWLNPYPIERAWCVWEIFGCVKSEQPLDILFRPGEEQAFIDTLLADRGRVTKRIADLRLENAQCFVSKDKQDIDEAIENQIGYHQLNVTISGLVIKWLKVFLYNVIDEKRDGGLHFAKILYEAGIFLKNQLGAYDEALEMLHESLRINEKTYGGRDHPSVAATLHSIASVLQNKGEYDAALKQYEVVLRILEKTYGGRDHPSVAATLHEIASVLQNKGEYDAALKQYEEVLRIKEKTYGGRDHPIVANTLHQIASVLQDKGEYDAALKQYEEVLRIAHQREDVRWP